MLAWHLSWPICAVAISRPGRAHCGVVWWPSSRASICPITRACATNLAATRPRPMGYRRHQTTS
jgi:hypothetical protein